MSGLIVDLILFCLIRSTNSSELVELVELVFNVVLGASLISFARIPSNGKSVILFDEEDQSVCFMCLLR